MSCEHDHHNPIVFGLFDIDTSMLRLTVRIGGEEIILSEYLVEVTEENKMALCESFRKAG